MRCILVRIRNCATGKVVFIGGFSTPEALRKQYPKAAPDPMVVNNISPGENPRFWTIEFKDIQQDGSEAIIVDPR